ncbi:protein FAR-RED ELONGATED HYPOCOTYL 3 [Sesamum angolense]|uniref:Protein FAR1-RELATED SEQUENCE n=1 Tax=Sesamum angolense TaxID=2727404 RepID=A0AAE2BVQ8_9LAMI|nr:protein FAR-RED ELONGATED HYPOCOTYL 3 [Sesamum angolense]
MLQDKYEDEAKADFDTWHRQPGLKSPSPYGKQMAKIYTHAVFKKFQVEVLGVVACHPKLEGKDGPTTTFKVQDFEQNKVHKVMWNDKTADTSCTCRLFEYNGFLCRHVMIILQISGVNNIPAKYILKRWTKDAKRREAVKNIVFTALEEALRKCESINSSVQHVTGPSSPSNDRLHEFEEVTRGKFSGKTIKEGITSGKEKGYLNFRPSAVDCSYVSQESVRRMGQLNLRVPTIGGISGNPDIVPVDQLNRIAPNRDDCFSNQAHIEELDGDESRGFLRDNGTQTLHITSV